MNKKLFTAFLFGAAVLSTSTFVSCKDYNDEISDLQTQIDNANSLHATKVALEEAKAELTDDYEAADEELAAEILTLTTYLDAADAGEKAAREAADATEKARALAAEAQAEAEIAALTERVTTTEAKIASLEAKITELEAADKKLQDLIDTKVDASEFKSTVEDIYAKIQTCSQECATNLANAVAKLETKDAELQAAIDKTAAELKAADEVLAKGISDNADAIKALDDKTAEADAALLKTIQENYAAQQKADSILSARIAVIESDYLTSADRAALQAGIDANVEAIKQANDKIQANADNISSNAAKIAANEAAITELAAAHALDIQAVKDQIAAVEEALKAKDAALQDAIDALKAKEAEDYNTLDGKISTNATDIAANKARIEEVYNTLNAKMDEINTDLKAKIEANTASITKNASDIAKNASDIATNASGIATNASGIATNAANIATNATNIANNAANIATNVQAIATNSGLIAGLRADVTTIQNQITVINEELLTLNVLIKTSLRSLVFIPDSYYWGIEATEINYLEYQQYALPTANVKTPDTFEGALVRGHSGTNGTKAMYTDGSKVLSFAANYHLNPSSANLSGAKYALVTADKEYVRTATEADALLSIVGTPTASNGILNVQLNADKPELIKSVPTNSAVTIFATQVTLPKDGAASKADTTITSDYATLYRSNIKNLVVAYNRENMPSITNTHCGDCSYYKNNSGETSFGGNHLFATEDELINYCSNKGQYNCDYNDSLDLTTLVETHYTDENGTHMYMTPEKLEACGLEYKFELVGLLRGQNKTSESVHAAIKHLSDGYWFRPQEASLVYDGEEARYEQKAYGAPQSRETIGRCPVVRVSLVDSKSQSVVYDYGYIEILITEAGMDPKKPSYKELDYTGSAINYYNTCNFDDWSYTKYWNNIEYDILKTLMDGGYSMTQAEFVKNYENSGDFVQDSNGDYAQYVYDSASKTYVALDPSKYIGEVAGVVDPEHEQTNIYKWTISGAYIVKNYYDKKGTQPALSTVAKIAAKDPTVYPDIYVKFSTGAINVTVPEADAFLESDKIDNYWYSTDGNGASYKGFDEIHAQTLSPEDEYGQTIADVLDTKFADVFTGNTIWYHYDATTYKQNLDWTSNTYGVTQTVGLYFSDNNKDKTYAALDGTNGTCTYTMKLAQDSHQLVAYKKNGKEITPVLVAWIDSLGTTKTDIKGNSYVVTINTQTIHYVKTAVAEALLNYAAHNNLDKTDANNNKVIKAIIVMKATNSCGHVLALNNKEFDVRFLRPINVTGNNKELEDAQDKAQTIELRDLINLTDWRDYKFADHKSYWNYYNIKSIQVIGTSLTYGVDQPINAYIWTTMKGANYTKRQSDVSGNVEFTVNYKNPTDKSKDSYGTITYKNLSSTVQEFAVRVPILVTYEWGYVTVEEVYVTVKDSHSNAKRR